MIKNNKKMQKKKYLKALSNILMNSPQWPVMWYAPNFRETEKIYWSHFFRATQSIIQTIGCPKQHTVAYWIALWACDLNLYVRIQGGELCK